MGMETDGMSLGTVDGHKAVCRGYGDWWNEPHPLAQWMDTRRSALGMETGGMSLTPWHSGWTQGGLPWVWRLVE